MSTTELEQFTNDQMDFSYESVNEAEHAGYTNIDVTAMMSMTPEQAAQRGSLEVAAQRANNPHASQMPYPPAYQQQQYPPPPQPQYVPQYQQPVYPHQPQYAPVPMQPQYAPQQQQQYVPMQQGQGPAHCGQYALYYPECIVMMIDAPGLLKSDINVSCEDMSVNVSWTRRKDWSKYDAKHGVMADQRGNIGTWDVTKNIPFPRIIDSVKWSYADGVIAITGNFRRKSAMVIEADE